MSSYIFTRRYYTTSLSVYPPVFLDSYVVGTNGDTDETDFPADVVCAPGLLKIFNIRIEDRVHDNLPYRLEFVTSRRPTKESVPLSEIIAEWAASVDTDTSDDEGELTMFGHMVKDYSDRERHVTCYILPDEYPQD